MNTGIRSLEIASVVVILLGGLFVLNGCLDDSWDQKQILLDVAHVDQIVKACKLYAQDWDGMYPQFDMAASAEAGKPIVFTSSTEAFNELIREIELQTEAIFYLPSPNPNKEAPNEDGKLNKDEDCFVYVTGQSVETPATSPLIANEMESPGVYGKYHPGLEAGKVVVGYCGGQVKVERLSQTSPGATVLGPEGSGIDDIFQQAEVTSDGRVVGGYLAVPRENILLP